MFFFGFFFFSCTLISQGISILGIFHTFEILFFGNTPAPFSIDWRENFIKQNHRSCTMAINIIFSLFLDIRSMMLMMMMVMMTMIFVSFSFTEGCGTNDDTYSNFQSGQRDQTIIIWCTNLRSSVPFLFILFGFKKRLVLQL